MNTHMLSIWIIFSIPWSYEDQTFDIEGKSYKPDFFFYDQYGELLEK